MNKPGKVKIKKGGIWARVSPELIRAGLSKMQKDGLPTRGLAKDPSSLTRRLWIEFVAGRVKI